MSNLNGLPSFKSYGDYSSDNYGAHCLRFSSPKIDIYFSYQTPVAFHTTKDGLVVRENVWGPTTGKHLNWINEDKKSRIPGAKFEKRLAKLVK